MKNSLEPKLPAPKANEELASSIEALFVFGDALRETRETSGKTFPQITKVLETTRYRLGAIEKGEEIPEEEEANRIISAYTEDEKKIMKLKEKFRISKNKEKEERNFPKNPQNKIRGRSSVKEGDNFDPRYADRRRR